VTKDEFADAGDEGGANRQKLLMSGLMSDNGAKNFVVERV
jgi:hypothetical protein